ncbi:TOBE domain-containing protein [Paracoccus actinidiae]|uniref:TOBE domain-containing protein n=1 Tax=Paracoccus actinidiae TaxID=3064531 RepID=UPI0027D2D373|nr:TOBE domain-containing protein [Paracoccus sp. M09]
MSLSTAAPAGNVKALPGRVEVMTFHGAVVEYQIATEAGPRITARASAPNLGGPASVPQGSRVWAHWSPQAGVIVSEH